MTVLIIFLIISAFPAYAFKKNSDKTVFLNIKYINCTAKDTEKLVNTLYDGIYGIKNMNMVSRHTANDKIRRAGFEPECNDRKCSIKYGKLLKADRVIYGSIQKYSEIFYQQYSTKGMGKYLLKRMIREYYIIKLYLADVHTKRVLAEITRRTSLGAINTTSASIANRLQKHYTAENPVKDSASADVVFSISTATSGLYPINAFNDIVSGSIGIAIDFRVTNLIYKNIFLGMDVGSFYTFDRKNNINLFVIIPVALFLGYDFLLPKNITISPLVRGGYFIHLISEDKRLLKGRGFYDFTTNVYFDPLISFKCEVGVTINRFRIFITPGYTVFFEEKNIGMFASVDIGFRGYF